MTDQEYPSSLQPGGAGTSPSLRPSSPSQHHPTYMAGQQFETSNLTDLKQDQSSNKFPSYDNTRSHSPQMPAMPFPQSGQQANYSGRFPSSHFPISSGGQAESSSAAQQNNGYGESQQQQQRSRSSTFGQSYPTPVGQALSMPGPPGSNSSQQLFPQHSGVSASSHQAFLRPNQPQTPPVMPQSTNYAGSSLGQPQSTTTTRPSSSQVTTNSATKSPFTSPLTSPPRNRPNQLLIVNATSTTPLTSTLINTLRPILPHALEVTAYTASYPCPTAIDSATDAVLSSESCLRDLAKYSTNNGETVQNFDAILICSFSKHPLIDAMRESYDVPVAGIMEASLYVARMLGARFGIITPNVRAKNNIDDAVASYGLSHFFVGADALNVSALDLVESTSSSSSQASGVPQTPPAQTQSKVKEELNKRITYVSRALIAKGADTIILGSEFLCSNEHIRVVKDAVREEDGRRTVNVIDPVEAGVMMLNGLIGMGVPTSKKGVYRSERDGRRARGQGWL